MDGMEISETSLPQRQNSTLGVGTPQIHQQSARLDKNKRSLAGKQFNEQLIGSILNTSRNKASYAFSKEKRFSSVQVNEQGYAVSIVGRDEGLRNKRASSIS